MVTKGIFKRIPLRDVPNVGVDVLVARLTFRSVKYADWFEDCTNRVCNYLYEHGYLASVYSVGGGADHYDPDLTAPIDAHVSMEVCGGIIYGARSIEYSHCYFGDVISLLALVSTVQVLSVHDVRRDLDEIVCEACSDYERTFGHGC